MEHPDIYTEGRHTLPEDSLPSSIKVERGGSITYHGYGQLVQYYIINLKERGKNVREIIETIHDFTIELLSSYKLNFHSFRNNCSKLFLYVIKSNSSTSFLLH